MELQQEESEFDRSENQSFADLTYRKVQRWQHMKN